MSSSADSSSEEQVNCTGFFYIFADSLIAARQRSLILSEVTTYPDGPQVYQLFASQDRDNRRQKNTTIIECCTSCSMALPYKRSTSSRERSERILLLSHFGSQNLSFRNDTPLSLARFYFRISLVAVHRFYSHRWHSFCFSWG